MHKENFLKRKLEAGKIVIGTWAIIPSVVVTDIISGCAIDFIIIDSEHGPINFESAQSMVIACESNNVSPVMRVGGIIESDILKALDIGIHCIQIPNITSAKHVQEIIDFVKYPPVGKRGFSPFTRAGQYSITNAKEHTNIANTNVMLAIHIEGIEALENIEEILSFTELDIVFIGIFDISKSLGIPGDVDHPKVKEMLRVLTQKINASGKFSGTIVNSFEQLEEVVKIGVKYITFSVDCNVISSSYRSIVKKFNELVISS